MKWLPFQFLLLLIALSMSSCDQQSSAITTFSDKPISILTTPISSNSGFQTEELIEYPQIQIVDPSNAQPEMESVQTIPYLHPNGLFSLMMPENWAPTPSEFSVIFSEPDRENKIYVNLQYVGEEFDDEAFSRFIDAREKNLFSSFESYIEISARREGSEREKQLVLNGDLITVNTRYMQQEEYVFSVDFWSFDNFSEPYRKLFDSIAASLGIKYGISTDVSQFSISELAAVKDENFIISVPVSWKENQTFFEGSSVTTFTSPDERGIVQIIIYHDLEYLRKSVSADLVLEILNSRYAKDLWVDSYNKLDDGSEQLKWNSYRGKYQGVSNYGTNGSAFWMLTGMWEIEYSNYYRPAIEFIFSSYLFVPLEGD